MLGSCKGIVVNEILKIRQLLLISYITLVLFNCEKKRVITRKICDTRFFVLLNNCEVSYVLIERRKIVKCNIPLVKCKNSYQLEETRWTH